MPIINAILGELDHEARTTAKVLERVPAEHLSWAPHAKSSSLGKLAWHIAMIPKTVHEGLHDGGRDLAIPRPEPIPAEPAEIVETFRRNQAGAREYLVTMTDEVLHEPFTLRRGDAKLLTISKIAAIRNILMNHTYHHRGQLTVYLRLLDVPLPSVYGSTADEQM